MTNSQVLQDNKATYQHYHDDIDLFTIVIACFLKAISWVGFGVDEWGPRALEIVYFGQS